MSADAFLRGTGNWTAYLDLGGPWLSAGWEMVANPAAIAAAAVAAAVGLAGLARRDLPDQLWLRLCVGLAAVIALAGYAGALGGPLHGLVQSELNGTLAPFRNVSKLEPVAAFALALGIAHVCAGASELLFRAPRGSRRVAAGIVLAPVIALCLAGLALPYLTGQILQPGSFSSVPRYWYQVAGFLAAHSPDQTALVVPGDSHGIYLWGDPIDEPLEPLATSPWVERSPGPVRRRGITGLPRHRGDRDRVRPAGPRAGRVPGPGGHPVRRGAQRPQPEPAGIHPAADRRGDTDPVRVQPGRLVRADDHRRSDRSGRDPPGPGVPAAVPGRRGLPGGQRGPAAVVAGRRAAGQRHRAGQRRPGLAAAACRAGPARRSGRGHRGRQAGWPAGALGGHRRAAPPGRPRSG